MPTSPATTDTRGWRTYALRSRPIEVLRHLGARHQDHVHTGMPAAHLIVETMHPSRDRRISPIRDRLSTIQDR